MTQKEFAHKVSSIVQNDDSVLGLAVGGSWLSNELDQFSDLDLILVTKEKVSGSKALMLQYAQQYGDLLAAFTGEHVGEPRLLICLYDNPLLHVDIKFVTLEEFMNRIETPVLLVDKNNALQQAVTATEARFPSPDYQWIEDRFWIWVHYALLKIGRGELFEAMDFLGYLRMVVLGPLLHIKNGNLPRGVRKVETQLAPEDFRLLKSTIAHHEKESILTALQHAVHLYTQLRAQLFDENIHLQTAAEQKVMAYFSTIKDRKHQEITTGPITN